MTIIYYVVSRSVLHVVKANARYAARNRSTRHHRLMPLYTNSSCWRCKWTSNSKTTVVGPNLLVLSVDAAESLSLAVGELVHRLLGDVETITGMVNCKDVDGVSVICDSVACATLAIVLVLGFMKWPWRYLPDHCSIQRHLSIHRCGGSQQHCPDFAIRI